VSNIRDLPSGRQPAINLPPVTAVIAALLIGIHLLRQFLPPALDDELVLTFALIPTRLTEAPLSLGAVATLFTHMLLHGGWLHLLVNTGMLLAFAAGLERMLGARRMLIIAVLSGLAGGLVHLAVYARDGSPMLGASGALSGLFGAMMFIMSERQRGWRFLAGVSALWLGVNVVMGQFGMPDLSGSDEVEIAWVAHVGGYVAGIAVIALMTYWGRRNWRNR
jgi:membrane associated rhomboid family serine protease